MVETKEEKEHVNVGANAGSSSLLWDMANSVFRICLLKLRNNLDCTPKYLEFLSGHLACTCEHTCTDTYTYTQKHIHRHMYIYACT